ncbi:MAG: dephospho-CoA kinase [Rhodobiaceae bacterium]|nr:dephospho-CoA kinase [Rhodobiaceae bacterium]|tara:strand:+ start:1128 stop:1712 length:585 start_codon:yes stop_codon:yes gene_type:complete
MIKIGLTGSIGMGKSETARIFSRLGIPVYDADASVHKLYESGNTGALAIKKIFPEAISGDGSVNRKILSSIVIGNKTNIKKLEDIIHPLLKNDRLNFFKKNINEKIVVLDIPLLFETKGESQVDYVVVVSTSDYIQKQRVLMRPNMTEDKFEKILHSQMPNKDKCQKADFIIDTSISVDDAKKQVLNILKKIEA